MPAFPLAAGSAALLILAMLSPPCAATTNFVVFLVDDWGWGDLGANGFGAETPNMDSYAARGVRFVDMHSNSVCTPTRSALQTGRLNLRMGVNGNFGTAARGGLALEEITIAQLLQQGANYSTSATGKVSAIGPGIARRGDATADRGRAACSSAIRHVCLVAKQAKGLALEPVERQAEVTVASIHPSIHPRLPLRQQEFHSLIMSRTSSFPGSGTWATAAATAGPTAATTRPGAATTATSACRTASTWAARTRR
jgi:hypothetical protein